MKPQSQMIDRQLKSVLFPIGAAMLILFGGVAFLSPQFALGEFAVQRPIVEVLLLFAMAFTFYLYACHAVIWRTQNSETDDPADEAQKAQDSQSDGGQVNLTSRPSLLTTIFIFGILFRLAMLFSTPILEVDIYRYLWDGFATVQTGNPYEFAPVEIIQTDYPPAYQHAYDRSPEEKATIARLAENAKASGYFEILGHVHFGQYTSPYPPTSQFVFTLAAVITPGDASTETRLAVMKAMLTLFDLGTAFLLVLLLRRAELPDSWVVAYLWCPLLMKEFANSGHLDSIAIFLTALFVWLCSKAFWPASKSHQESPPPRTRSKASFSLGLVTAIVLALAVGAKIYPAVLGPAWAVIIWKRFGFKSVLMATCFIGCVVLINWPMLKYLIPESVEPTGITSIANESKPANELKKPTPGITAFTKSWEMNDLLFMAVIENVKPTGDGEKADTSRTPWFVVTSNRWRHAFSDWRLGTREARDQIAAEDSPNSLTAATALTANDHRLAEFQSAFSFTRKALLGLLVLILLYCGVRLYYRDTIRAFAEMAFYSLAWFWLLSPTQNPWYWCWALPFLPFVKPKAWYLLAGATLAYYLRFHFESQPQYNSAPIFGTPYSGTSFFDFVIPFFEFGLPLLLVIVAFLWSQREAPASKPNST